VQVDTCRVDGESELREVVLDVVNEVEERHVGVGAVQLAGTAGDGLGGGDYAGEGRLCGCVANVVLHGYQVGRDGGVAVRGDGAEERGDGVGAGGGTEHACKEAIYENLHVGRVARQVFDEGAVGQVGGTGVASVGAGRDAGFDALEQGGVGGGSRGLLGGDGGVGLGLWVRGSSGGWGWGTRSRATAVRLGLGVGEALPHGAGGRAARSRVDGSAGSAAREAGRPAGGIRVENKVFSDYARFGASLRCPIPARR
jgi:hypothetical protein